MHERLERAAAAACSKLASRPAPPIPRPWVCTGRQQLPAQRQRRRRRRVVQRTARLLVARLHVSAMAEERADG
eukprot:SAG11_NODE_8278_length_1035_cov_1.742521_1_plen_72_part_10